MPLLQYVSAIDFGTSNTAVAYAKIPKHETSSVDIILFELDKNKPKTKTVVAIDTDKPHGKQCIALGDQVVHLFQSEDGDFHSNVLIFEHFKMVLHSESSDDVIAHNGRKLKVKHVIGETLRFIVDKTIEQINKCNIDKVGRNEILWVLTIPAIWSWKAKKTMREAMTSYCSIEDCKLVEALEPECASITLWVENPQISSIQSNTVMIVDMGGGTVDISVHKMNAKQKRLESKLEARGGDWGGRNIDNSLFKFLSQMFKFDFQSSLFKQKSDYYEMSKNIEEVKQAFAEKFNSRDYEKKYVSLSMDYDAVKYNIATSVNEHKKNTKDQDLKDVECLQRSFGIKISHSIFYKFYKENIKNITNHLEEIIQNLKKRNVEIDCIYLAGGMAEAKIMESGIREIIIGKPIAVVTRPQIAIVKGAVYYGLNQNIIKTRLSAFTYGLSVDVPFKNGFHDQRRKITDGNRTFCSNVFQEILKAGTEIETNQTMELSAPPTKSSQKNIEFSILQTRKENPIYADEDGIEKLATITIDISRCMKLPMEKRTIKVKFLFGSTIIQVHAVNEETNVQQTVYVSFDYTNNTKSKNKRGSESEDISDSSKKSKVSESSSTVIDRRSKFIEELLEMGFERKEIDTCLKAANYSEPLTIEFLVNEVYR